MYVDYLRGSAFAVDSYWHFQRSGLRRFTMGRSADPANRNGWDDARLNDHWYIIEGETRPFLRAEYSTNIQNLHQLQLIDMNGAANYRLARNIDATQELASGMWKGGAFSPIRPVTWTDLDIKTYSFPAPGIPVVQVMQAYIPEPTAVSNFTGTFDGQGHTISNLYVNRTLGITNPYSTGAGNNAGSVRHDRGRRHGPRSRDRQQPVHHVDRLRRFDRGPQLGRGRDRAVVRDARRRHLRQQRRVGSRRRRSGRIQRWRSRSRSPMPA